MTYTGADVRLQVAVLRGAAVGNGGEVAGTDKDCGSKVSLPPCHKSAAEADPVCHVRLS